MTARCLHLEDRRRRNRCTAGARGDQTAGILGRLGRNDHLLVAAALELKEGSKLRQRRMLLARGGEGQRRILRQTMVLQLLVVNSRHLVVMLLEILLLAKLFLAPTAVRE